VRLILATIVFILSAAACKTGTVENQNQGVDASTSNKPTTELISAMTAVKPFFSQLSAPGPSDWLASFQEPGQTFAEYLKSDPTVPTTERGTIYVLPLGKFTYEQKRVIDLTSVYLEAFYGLSIKALPQQTIKRPLRIKDSRVNAISKKEQVRTGYILDEILRLMLPSDAAALIAFTNEDLYPDNSMNYVFGQASLENRVGIWSLYRLHDNADLPTFLRRTIKIAAHETGHMFSMHHCTAYNCVMSGSNHINETDSHPIDACPECMAKICWFSHVSPAERYRKLAEACRKIGLEKEALEFDKKFAAVNAIK
jgi:archaemetzincin